MLTAFARLLPLVVALADLGHRTTAFLALAGLVAVHGFGRVHGLSAWLRHHPIRESGS
ncbi:MAG TPA: hypothetical protein VFM74_02400 [Candidatus Limnocylindria bacterium]|nr:hypothetical protein [Candidatus Limnocylindria bacterium]